MAMADANQLPIRNAKQVDCTIIGTNREELAIRAERYRHCRADIIGEGRPAQIRVAKIHRWQIGTAQIGLPDTQVREIVAAQIMAHVQEQIQDRTSQKTRLERGIAPHGFQHAIKPCLHANPPEYARQSFNNRLQDDPALALANIFFGMGGE
jgi:hypothetical protein